MTSDQDQPTDRARSTFGQSDVVPLGDEDAVKQLAAELDDTVELIRASRETLLRAQATP